MFQQVKSDHADNNCRQHQFQNREISEKKLPGNYVIISSPAFLEEKTKSNAEEQTKEYLCFFVFVKCNQHSFPSSCTDDPEDEQGRCNPPDKEAACRNDTGNRKLN